jgi:hypothetical protein
MRRRRRRRRDEWVVVERTDSVLHWTDGGTEELVDDRASCSWFIADCAQYLPDPRAQAELDVPRMTVRVNGAGLADVRELEQAAAPDQRVLLYVLCNQVLFGQAYDCATTGLPADYLVCESGHSAQVDLLAAELRPPYRVHTLVASKQMRVMHLETQRSTPVTLSVYLSLKDDRVQIGAARRER